jgi:hypothetical protein
MTKKEKRIVRKVLKMMLENQDLFKSGLCSWVDELKNCGKIYYSEFCTVRRFIKAFKPANCNLYWWTPAEIEPRITWIKEQIVILEEETQGFFSKLVNMIYGRK